MIMETPRSERLHIGFFGARNAGKSSLVNAVTNQELSVVSDVKGTTTDPVIKSMELLPLGPVAIIDTPGFDDVGGLGEKRVEKTKQILSKTDIAVLCVDSKTDVQDCDRELLNLFKEKNIPYIIAYTKKDLLSSSFPVEENALFVSSKTGEGIGELKDKIGSLAPKNQKAIHLVADFIKKGDVVILVTPIDESAPKARLILPQQQAIRDILDAGACAFVCQDSELEGTLNSLKNPPSLVVCDSQVFKKVSEIVPESVPLTSFSILFARYKGILSSALSGIEKIGNLKDGDKILIAEGCTHHRQCGDIGTVKMPMWIKNYTGKDLEFDFTSGGGFPENLSEYALIVHCGSCMLTDKEVLSRLEKAKEKGTAITNYGTLIAHMNGILERSTRGMVK